MSIISRRGLLGAAAATAAASLLPGMAAMAAAPFRNVLPPAWQRFKIGEFEATIVSDGSLPLGKPEPAFPASPPAEIQKLLTSNFLDPGSATLEQNILILNTGRQLILFDTGMGESMGAASKMFGPTTGKLLANMRAAGIEPEQIDLVVLTHAHCDHCWGLVDADGKRVFPNAQVAISEIDLKFWTDDANKKGPEFMVPFIDGAKKNLGAYKDRMVMVKDEQPVVPGVVAISSPGHTFGHTCYAITSGNTTVVNTGDWRTTRSSCCASRCGNSPTTPTRSCRRRPAPACSTGSPPTGIRSSPTTSPGPAWGMWRRKAKASAGIRRRST